MDDATMSGRCEMRIRHYASDLADRVESGELSELEANQLLSDLQDRLARDGAWG